jgi:hypothetical protein
LFPCFGSPPVPRQVLILFYRGTAMEIPQYLYDALYQFSEDVLDERDHFDELQKQADDNALKTDEQKENWFTHLFREKKPTIRG